MPRTDISKSWRVFQRRVSGGETARQIGFPAKDGDVSRFLARFRAARNFRAAEFAEFTKSTADGYSALIGLLLAWGSFEQLARISGAVKDDKLDYRKIDEMFARSSKSLSDRSWNAARPFYGFLATLTSSKALCRALTAAADGGDLSPRELVLALRHSFAHGALTPHFGGSNPRRTIRACRALTEHLLAIQVAEFERVVGEQPGA